MISIIIPAFNEAKTIARVLEEIVGHPKVMEIIVVDDGSRDGTSDVVKAFAAAHPEGNIKALRLDKNVGKADAMDLGVQEAQSDIICFLDADVIGFTHQKLSVIIDPVIERRYEMFVGVRARKVIFFNKYFRFFPIISGERALTKFLWSTIPRGQKNCFKIEIALNFASKRTKKGMGFTRIIGLNHVIKEQKYGFWTGLWRRLLMIWDVLSISLYLYVFVMTGLFFRSIYRRITAIISPATD